MPAQRDFDRRIRIGLVGAGGHAYRNLLPALTYLPVELVAICDISQDRAQATARQYGAPQVYTDAAAMFKKADLDAVLIAVSAEMHPQLAELAFESGLHVWVEKPPAVSAKHVEKLIGLRGDLVAVVGFKKAFMPATRKAREIFAQPEYGPMNAVFADYPIVIPPDGAAVLRDGLITDWLSNGCHPLSFMLAVAGKPLTVTSHTNSHGAGVCFIEFEGGVVGSLNLGYGAGMTAPIESYRMHGKECTLLVENSWRVRLFRRDPEFRYGETASYLGEHNAAMSWEPQNAFATIENMPLFIQGIVDELRHFCDAVLDKKPATLGTLEFALRLMQTYEAALISSGKTITLPA